MSQRIAAALTSLTLIGVLFAGVPSSVRGTDGFAPVDETWVATTGTAYYGGGSTCEHPTFVTNGTNDEDAIEDAITHVVDAGIVHICAGTYNFTNDIVVTNNFTISGAGAGTTILNQVGPRTEFAESGFFDITGDVILTGMTLQNAHTYREGGALRATGTITVRNAVFKNNFADRGGAAIAGLDTTSGTLLDVQESTFTSNSTNDVGGAIAAYGNVRSTDSIFTNNTSTADINCRGGGGAIVAQGDVGVFGSTFTNNKAVLLANTDVTACGSGTAFGGYGGAILTTALAIAEGSQFTSNSATFGGGAILALNNENPEGQPSLAINSTFTGNSAHIGGALLSFAFSVEGSTFTANSARNVGGAIVGDFVGVTTSSFVGNRSASGGAIWVISWAQITNSTFKRNTATALRTGSETFRLLGDITVAGGLGGAIAGSGSLTLTDNRFTRNRASVAGGAVWLDYGVAESFALMKKNRFVGNRAGKAGGAIGFSSSASTVTRSQIRAATRANRFSGNSAPRGPLIQSRAIVLFLGAG